MNWMKLGFYAIIIVLLCSSFIFVGNRSKTIYNNTTYRASTGIESLLIPKNHNHSKNTIATISGKQVIFSFNEACALSNGLYAIALDISSGSTSVPHSEGIVRYNYNHLGLQIDSFSGFLAHTTEISSVFQDILSGIYYSYDIGIAYAPLPIQIFSFYKNNTTIDAILNISPYIPIDEQLINNETISLEDRAKDEMGYFLPTIKKITRLDCSKKSILLQKHITHSSTFNSDYYNDYKAEIIGSSSSGYEYKLYDYLNDTITGTIFIE